MNFIEIADDLKIYFNKLEQDAIKKLELEGFNPENIKIKHRFAFMRFKGQDAVLEVEYINKNQLLEDFEKLYRRIYGHWEKINKIEIESVRVIASTPEIENVKKAKIAYRISHHKLGLLTTIKLGHDGEIYIADNLATLRAFAIY